jgi:hypothetical protein
VVGLRRPGGCLLRRRRPTPGAERLGRPISIGVEAFGRWSACADRRDGLCVGGGRRLAWRVPNEFGLWGPSAGGRPAPTEGIAFASAEADAWRGGCRMNSACGGLRPMVGLRRPGGVFCVGGDRRLARRVPNEFGLGRPSAGGRPVPTGRGSFASAEADAWRGAPLKADFNRRGGLRPAVGLRRPGGGLLRRRRPTPGAQAPWKADFNRRGGLRPMVGLRRPGGCLLRWQRPTPGVEGAE